MSAPPLPPTASPLPRRRNSGVGRIVLISVVLAAFGAAIIPGYYLEERIRGQMAWRRYVAEAKARGVKFDFADFIPPKIPDEQNFASIPIFDAAFRASDRGQKVPNPFELPKPPKGEMPGVGGLNAQKLIDLVAWQKYFVETKMLPAAGENAAADVLKALDRYAAPLAQLHEAARRPHCRFPMHWEKGPGAAFPHEALLQSAAKLLALRVAAHLALGESGAAYEDFHDGLRLSTATLPEPALIPGLVREANAIVMETVVWSGLASHQWAEPELRKIEADLSALDWPRDYVFAMSSERVASTAIVDMCIKNPRMLAHIGKLGGDDSADLHEWPFLFYPAGWSYFSKVRLNRYFDELLARVDPVQRRWFGERAVPSSVENMKDMSEKIHYLVLVIAAPAYASIEKHYVQLSATTDQARLACVLERFRLAHGRFPAALGELTPEFIPALPFEMVNGESYHYRLLEDGNFVLYSVGLDRRDNGGVIDPKLGSSKQLDWVWRYPAK